MKLSDVPGLDPVLVNLLNEEGIQTCKSLMKQSKQTLREINGIRRPQLDNIIAAVEAHMASDLHQLNGHGITSEDISKLGLAGIRTCKGITLRSKKIMAGVRGISKFNKSRIVAAAEAVANTRKPSRFEVEAAKKGYGYLLGNLFQEESPTAKRLREGGAGSQDAGLM